MTDALVPALTNEINETESNPRTAMTSVYQRYTDNYMQAVDITYVTRVFFFRDTVTLTFCSFLPHKSLKILPDCQQKFFPGYKMQ